ncbi:MAG: shikimate dehydrogenase, partial [Chthoniobacterales bacterium]|nr:shikimate dehydrogenase [Chthoniobacterales bacterium]
MKPVYDLADLRHWREATRDVDPPVRLGVFGEPVEHSLSPPMQNAALRHCGIAARYARFQIRRSELPEAVDRARELGFIGLNLTVPHKSAALPLLDDAKDNALIIGSVNTISLKDARIVGYN